MGRETIIGTGHPVTCQEITSQVQGEFVTGSGRGGGGTLKSIESRFADIERGVGNCFEKVPVETKEARRFFDRISEGRLAGDGGLLAKWRHRSTAFAAQEIHPLGEPFPPSIPL